MGHTDRQTDRQTQAGASANASLALFWGLVSVPRQMKTNQTNNKNKQQEQERERTTAWGQRPPLGDEDESEDASWGQMFRIIE